ncbi:MAG: DUF1080 domain-containing protein [Gemmataceae bacterium]
MTRYLAMAALILTILCSRSLISAREKPAAAADKVKTLFDGKSLTGWKVAKFGDEGAVRVKDGAIIMEKGKMLTGIVYAGDDFPRLNYEITYQGKKLAGDDFFCAAVFPVGEDSCSFVAGGWRGTVVGLSNINGANASENETNRSMTFERDRWYRFRLRVVKDRIQAWIDDEKVVDFDSSDVKLSLHIAGRPCRPFGLMTFDTTGAVCDIRLRTVTGPEKDKPSK